MLEGFVKFVREQGVIGLAIGFILGGAVSKVVASLVDDIIQPILGSVLGSANGLSALSVGSVTYGHFLTTAIDFVIIAAVIYFMFKALGIEKLDPKKK